VGCVTCRSPRCGSGDEGSVIDAAARRCGAQIISIDRPGIWRSGHWAMTSIAQCQHRRTGRHLLHLNKFAIAGWSGGGSSALACAAAMPERVRAVATMGGMAPLQRARDVLELGSWQAGPPKPVRGGWRRGHSGGRRGASRSLTAKLHRKPGLDQAAAHMQRLVRSWCFRRERRRIG
jgi:pimeloyl-ACP methyl ester carboxylesterase